MKVDHWKTISIFHPILSHGLLTLVLSTHQVKRAFTYHRTRNRKDMGYPFILFLCFTDTCLCSWHPTQLKQGIFLAVLVFRGYLNISTKQGTLSNRTSLPQSSRGKFLVLAGHFHPNPPLEGWKGGSCLSHPSIWRQLASLLLPSQQFSGLSLCHHIISLPVSSVATCLFYRCSWIQTSLFFTITTIISLSHIPIQYDDTF